MPDDDEPDTGTELEKIQRRDSEQIRKLSQDQTPPTPRRGQADAKTLPRTPPLGVPRIAGGLPIVAAPKVGSGPERRLKTTGDEIKTAEDVFDRGIGPILEKVEEIKRHNESEARLASAFRETLNHWRAEVETEIKVVGSKLETIAAGPDAQLENITKTVDGMSSDNKWLRRYFAGFIVSAVVAAFVFGGWIKGIGYAQDDQRSYSNQLSGSIDRLSSRVDKLEDLVHDLALWRAGVDSALQEIQQSLTEIKQRLPIKKHR